jgi:hypothetical protein
LDQQVDIWIAQAEDTWLELLHAHADELFKQSFLPSHDQDHHRRVWHICRELLRELYANHSPVDQSLVSGVLIAAYFHDLGMVHSAEIEHGRLGREICIKFFADRNLVIPARYREILRAVELHDLKDERVYRGLYPGQAPDILSILSIADDLDALGIIGTYRYAEIYLKRGIRLKDLGEEVLGNVKVRFSNILEHCRIGPDLVNRYRKRYAELVDFFEDYNLQSIREPDPEKVCAGPLGVVNQIRRLSVEGQTIPENFLEAMEMEPVDEYVTDFFRKLKNELESDHH